MTLYWLCYRHNNQISVVIEPGASLVHARLRASLDGLDEGDFTEGHDQPINNPESDQILDAKSPKTPQTGALTGLRYAPTQHAI